MPVNVVISAITGTSPYDIYICDTGNTTCVYVTGITSGDLSYSFNIPTLFESVPTLSLKIVDSDGCVVINNFNT